MEQKMYSETHTHTRTLKSQTQFFTWYSHIQIGRGDRWRKLQRTRRTVPGSPGRTAESARPRFASSVCPVEVAQLVGWHGYPLQTQRGREPYAPRHFWNWKTSQIETILQRSKLLFPRGWRDQTTVERQRGAIRLQNGWAHIWLVQVEMSHE